MAGAGLLSLLDDVASFLDDVAAMTKVAAKKTAGVIGDDLALNAQQVGGVSAERGVSAAVAVELVHNFSLLHDDIMDGDTERRHRATQEGHHAPGVADEHLAPGPHGQIDDLWATRLTS